MPKDGNTFYNKTTREWKWLFESVPSTLESYHVQGYKIVLLTDQTKLWKIDMISDMVSHLSFSPTIIISTSKSTNKPNTALFYSHISKAFNKKSSFYVGDALGREGDWSSVDRDVALNLGVTYYAPEDIFQADESNNYEVEPVDYLEVVIMVGYPGSGKSTLAESLCNKSSEYVIISGDTFKTPEKMIKEAQKYASMKSIIFDATNTTIAKRKNFIDFAEFNGYPVRCLWIDVDVSIAIQRIATRVQEGGNHVPKIALYKLRKTFEQPTEHEGFELTIFF